MLKKGQPGWIDNAKPQPVVAPLLSHICDSNGEMINLVRWPSRKPKKKCFGLRRSAMSYAKKRFYWTDWYYTATDRNEALSAFRKHRRNENIVFDLIER